MRVLSDDYGDSRVCAQSLTPPLSELPPEPPTLLAFLNSSSNFTLFRRYVLVRCACALQSPGLVYAVTFISVPICVFLQTYNLSDELASSDFTLLLPTDEAVRKYLSRTNTSTLVGPDEEDLTS